MCGGGTSCHCPLRTARGPRVGAPQGSQEAQPDPPPWPGRLQVSARRWATLPARRGSSGEAMGRVGRRAPERGWQPPDSRGAHRGEGKSCGANARSRRRGPAPLLLLSLLLLLSSSSQLSTRSSSRSLPALATTETPSPRVLCLSCSAAGGAGRGDGPGPVRPSPAASQRRSPSSWCPGPRVGLPSSRGCCPDGPRRNQP